MCWVRTIPFDWFPSVHNHSFMLHNSVVIHDIFMQFDRIINLVRTMYRALELVCLKVMPSLYYQMGVYCAAGAALVENAVDPDQLAPEEAILSGPTLFTKLIVNTCFRLNMSFCDHWMSAIMISHDPCVINNCFKGHLQNPPAGF